MSSTNSSERFTAPDGSLVALVDCDNFYASCERVARPDLARTPIVVLSNNDGCIVARSREAKALGIPMGEPEYKLHYFLEKHGVAIFSSNYTLYGDLSHRVMKTIESVVPNIEVYSIDEAFAILSGALSPNADEIVRLIKQRARQWVGLPVSIGLAPTKVLAKIATRVAKKYPAYNGIFDLSSCTKLDLLLSKVAVEDIWGIGRHGALKLRCEGICNALQLREADPGRIKKLLTVNGLNILMELRGIPAIREDIALTHTTIISSRSLGYKVTTFEPLAEAIAFHAARAAEKLRIKNLVAGVVSARIQTGWYEENKPQHDEMVSISLRERSSDSSVIIRAAQAGLKQMFRQGYAYAKAMVMLTDFARPDKEQGSILSALNKEQKARREKLMAIMDKINRVEGRGTVYLAAQGIGPRDWHMKRARLSPCWTTDIKQLLCVS